MRLEIHHWIPHHNMIIFSCFYFCQENNIEFDIQMNPAVSWNGVVLYFNNFTYYLDYSDDSSFLDDPKKYHYYFKRSLRISDVKENVYPLNFQANYSYKSLFLLTKFKGNDLVNKANRIEIIRSLDYFNAFTNSSHNAMDIRKLPKNVSDNQGRVIFYTRLWNPDNHIDPDEKERRRLQNEFRIESCRIIKKHFEKVLVGLFPDGLSSKLAPDLLLDAKQTSIKEYYKVLKKSDIGIADDGLKDTPGWKIGEYLLFGKAVISTPLNVAVDNFEEHINYEKLSSRSSYLELPDKIDYLLKDKKYLEMGNNNLNWSNEYLHPKNYIKRIFSVTKNSNHPFFDCNF
ncbi:hypothetical protein [Flavobacterium eburneipallidum]|uniref:hypothetical protein n=1 Tax=Flavobacterium eburneipallidum TaxID=3003263 RepID=UPI002482551C|nr:hypothetical protein [Flavobacterium eburneipallidum]